MAGPPAAACIAGVESHLLHSISSAQLWLQKCSCGWHGRLSTGRGGDSSPLPKLSPSIIDVKPFFFLNSQLAIQKRKLIHCRGGGGQGMHEGGWGALS